MTFDVMKFQINWTSDFYLCDIGLCCFSLGNRTGNSLSIIGKPQLIIDSTIANYGTSMCILMAGFLFISELFSGLDPTIGY